MPFKIPIITLFLFVSVTYVFVGMAVSQNESSASSKDKYRPQIHFSVPKNWMNDPNGMVYLDGEYHLYYQYYPNDSVWGPMHWGHAMTTNLVSWTDLPIALYPDKFGQIWSGSAVADFTNSAGFKNGTNTPIVAVFTNGNGPQPQQQSLAYSNDNGRTYTKYEGNPVIPNPGIQDFRDPKVIRYSNDSWVLALAAGTKAMFYGSEDLKNWTLLSEFGHDPLQGSHAGVWECPDLLKMTIGNETVWVLIISINPGGPNGGSVTQYFIGDFDGKNFSSTQVDPLWLDWGTDNYAGVTFFSDPQGRDVLIAWMNNWDYGQFVPTNGWRGQMTLPRVLQLTNATGQIRLQSTFAPEIEILNKPEERFEIANSTEIQGNKSCFLTDQIPWKNPLLYLDLNFDISEIGKDSSFGICFLNSMKQEVCVGYENGDDHNVYLDRTLSGLTNFSDKFHLRPTATREALDTKIRFHIYLDVSAIEVLVDSGLTSMTAIFYPDELYSTVEIRYRSNAEGGKLVLNSAVIQGLKSMSEI